MRPPSGVPRKGWTFFQSLWPMQMLHIAGVRRKATDGVAYERILKTPGGYYAADACAKVLSCEITPFWMCLERRDMRNAVGAQNET